MTPLLERLRRAGALGALDVHFAERLADLCGEGSPEVRLAAALAARQLSEAHVCLDLRDVAGRSPDASGAVDAEALAGHVHPRLGEWRRLLERSRLVGGPGDTAPLVLDGPRLYLRRYHEYETRVAACILERAGRADVPVDRALLAKGLRRLFPGPDGQPDWQRVAAAVSVLRPFAVVSGGPGTGKTRTVARILALLVEQDREARRPPSRIVLLAPTGKAAARLRESIREERGRLDVEAAVREAIPDQASTIHRALGAGAAGYRYHEGRPLVADTVVVDEASMVDLALMARLLAAIPRGARLILLGDRDQLASVEAGSVLADLCGDDTRRRSRFRPALAAAIRELGGDEIPGDGAAAIDDSIVYLQKSWRFDDHAGIGRAAAAIRALGGGGSAAAVADAFASGGAELRLVEPGTDLAAILAPRAIAGYGPILREPDPATRLERLSEFRVLCAHRRGPEGIEAVNAIVETALTSEGVLTAAEPRYAGQILLVTRNDPATRLFNGDVGLVVEREAETAGAARQALFPDLAAEPADGPAPVRRLSLARLPAVETAFAMTVHKSQGSEFGELVVVLPSVASPVLTRELLYTAITRARRAVAIVATRAAVTQAAATATRRSSGLAGRLRPGPSEEALDRSGSGS